MECKTNSFIQVISIFEKLGHNTENITEETPLRDYIDSLEAVEILLEIEKKLDTRIEADIETEWQTVGDIVNDYHNIKNRITPKNGN